MSMLKAFLVLLGLAGLTNAQCTSGISCFDGECIQDQCVCASGFSGSQCNTAESGCGAYANLTNLETDNFPTLVLANSRILNGNLLLQLTSPLVNNRRSTFIYLNDPVAFPQCSFSAWSKTFVGCSEQYDFSLPWASAVACGWSAPDTTTYPGYSVYTNDLFVKHHDELSVFRGTPIYRDTLHTFPVSIKFQTQVEVSTTLSVFAPVNLLAAITRQTYDPVTSAGVIQVTTSLQWPFQLANPTLNGQPVSMSIVLTGSDVACGGTNGDACEQLYNLAISPQAACSLSGEYVLGFDIVCRGPANACPLDAATASATVTGNVNSENFCVGLEIDIGLTGSLSVFGDEAYSVAKNSFLQSQTAWFRAQLSTDGTATILSSTIVDIRINDGASTTYLRQAGSQLPAGTSVGLAMIAGSPAAQPAFSLIPDNSIFFVPVDENRQFTVFAVIDVSYTNGAKKRVNLKRQVQPGSQPTEASAVIGLEGAISDSEPSPVVSSEEQEVVLAAGTVFSLF